MPFQCIREGYFQRIKEEEGEGCNIHGFLDVNKVAGNFHFMPGKSFHHSKIHVDDLLAFQTESYDVSSLSYFFLHFVWIYLCFSLTHLSNSIMTNILPLKTPDKPQNK